MERNRIIVAALCVLVCAAFMGGCGEGNVKPVATNEKPVIDGAEDIECLEKQTVDLLDSVRALDLEDGDITPSMTISVDNGASVTGGIVSFPSFGEYHVTYGVKDGDGNEASASSTITVHERQVYKSFPDDESDGEDFNSKNSDGESVQVVDGKVTYEVGSFSTKDSDNELSYSSFTFDDCSQEYIYSFTAKANYKLGVKVILVTSVGWETLLWKETEIGTEEKEYRLKISQPVNGKSYQLVWQFGSEANSAYTDAVIEISDIHLEYLNDYEDFD